jgi:hypothetical protein
LITSAYFSPSHFYLFYEFLERASDIPNLRPTVNHWGVSVNYTGCRQRHFSLRIVGFSHGVKPITARISIIQEKSLADYDPFKGIA